MLNSFIYLTEFYKIIDFLCRKSNAIWDKLLSSTIHKSRPVRALVCQVQLGDRRSNSVPAYTRVSSHGFVSQVVQVNLLILLQLPALDTFYFVGPNLRRSLTLLGKRTHVQGGKSEQNYFRKALECIT